MAEHLPLIVNCYIAICLALLGSAVLHDALEEIR